MDDFGIVTNLDRDAYHLQVLQETAAFSHTQGNNKETHQMFCPMKLYHKHLSKLETIDPTQPTLYTCKSAETKPCSDCILPCL